MTGMNTAFSHALRVHLCSSCGGAVHASTRGGEVTCRACSTKLQLAPRDDRPLLGPERADMNAWRAELEEQRPLRDEPPVDVVAAVAGGGLSDAALQMWQRLRAQVSGQRDEGAERRLFHLTVLMAQRMEARDEELRLRALIETTLDTLPEAKHQQVLLTELALAAMRAGDMPTAEDWLSRCTRWPDDLRADSAYRAAAAEHAIRSGRSREALTLLFSQAQDWPFHRAYAMRIALLRTNALERLGSLDKAVAELSALMAVSEEQAMEVEARVRNSGDLRLCRKSFAPAREQAEQLRIQRAQAPAPDPVLRRALPWVLLALLAAAGAVAAHLARWQVAEQPLSRGLLLLAVLLALPGGIILLRGSRKARSEK